MERLPTLARRYGAAVVPKKSRLELTKAQAAREAATDAADGKEVADDVPEEVDMCDGPGCDEDEKEASAPKSAAHLAKDAKEELEAAKKLAKEALAPSPEPYATRSSNHP